MDDRRESTFLNPRHMTPCREWSGHVVKFLNFSSLAPFSLILSRVSTSFISGLFYLVPFFLRTFQSLTLAKMGFIGNAAYLAFHPLQLRSIIQWYVFLQLRALLPSGLTFSFA